jgi:uncharacterized Zn finger protein
MWWRYQRKPSVAEQRTRAQKVGRSLAREGRQLAPVVIQGRKIARSFWGTAWCENLESYQDLAYRLPRGRSYVRNGAVIDLAVDKGRISALVSGSEVYTVEVTIKELEAARWASLKTRSAGQIGSLIELLEGRLSEGVMRIVTDRDTGLFPKPAEISMSCSCPDYATMCKHVAAVLYGVGARLDEEPQLLFRLRHVDHAELITGATVLAEGRRGTRRRTIASDDIGDVFGIEIAEEEEASTPTARPVARAMPSAARSRPARGAVRKLDAPGKRAARKK